MGAARAVRSLLVINQPDGFDCPGAHRLRPPPANGIVSSSAKAAPKPSQKPRRKLASTLSFAAHSLADLRERPDYWLGRARHLRSLENTNQAVFYTSGRTSNDDLFRFAMPGDRGHEERARRSDITPDRDEHVNDLAVSVDSAVHIAPHADDFDVCLVDEPALARQHRGTVAPRRSATV